jgi:uncharacterized protein (TIGR00369 family)
MTAASSRLAAFLELAADPRGQPYTTRMVLGPRTRNSYGAPLGGAIGALIAESAQAISPHQVGQRIQVRFLAGVKDGALLAVPHVIGTECEISVSDDTGRLAAFGIVSFRTASVDTGGNRPGPVASASATRRRERQWAHVPLLDALDIEEGEAVSDGLCFEMPTAPVAQNADGSPHAGALFALVDLAAGQMAQRSQPPGPVVTLDAEIRILASPTTGFLRAHATPLHAGRRVVTSAVVVEDSINHIALATVAMLRVGP